MSLVLDHIHYTYPGSEHGLHDVSLQIGTGELVAVIGASGSGKSTLLQLVAGLLNGHQGRISLHGDDLHGVPVHLRRIGMVFQSYALFPHLSVLDNVAYGLKLRGIDTKARHARAQQLLETVGLAEHATRGIGQLSGGQQQRVALARALAIDPRALLLDEPLSALDASIRGHLRDQIRQLQQQFGATTLLVTHDQEEALAMADRVAVLQGGRLLQFATPREVYEQPANRSVAAFVGHSTLLPATVAKPGQIDLGFAQLYADTGTRAPGSAVWALLRPEHLVPDPPTGTINRITGRCSAQRYLGAIVRYDFQVDGSPQPWLGEARHAPLHAIAIAPEQVRLLDS
jgi:putative spermidine/putrescine transport system ATP-binding protein